MMKVEFKIIRKNHSLTKGMYETKTVEMKTVGKNRRNSTIKKYAKHHFDTILHSFKILED